MVGGGFPPVLVGDHDGGDSLQYEYRLLELFSLRAKLRQPSCGSSVVGSCEMSPPLGFGT